MYGILVIYFFYIDEGFNLKNFFIDKIVYFQIKVKCNVNG